MNVRVGMALCLGVGIGSTAPAQEVVPGIELNPYQSVMGDDGRTHPWARGVWHLEGYGTVVEITAHRVRQFEVTSAGAWCSDVDEASDMLVATSVEGGHLAITPLESIPPHMGVRMDALPDRCASPAEWTPSRGFGLFCDSMSELYPFFEAREFDWAARVDALRPQVSDAMSDRELFDVLTAALDGLGDGHVSLQGEVDGSQRTASAGADPTDDAIEAAYLQQRTRFGIATFRAQRMRELRERRVEELMGGAPSEACSGNLQWGKMDDETGYLAIDGMMRYADSEEFSFEDELSSLHAGMDRVLSDLASCERMVVDVSLNGGGMDLISVHLASRFADARRLGFSKAPRGVPEHGMYVVPHTGGPVWTKPTCVVTSDLTASAAEIFTMCMRAMPHVETAGLPTAGALSDILAKTFPNGWTLGMSNEIYRDHRGICHEGPGVPPDVELELFDPAEPGMAHADMMRDLVDLLWH